MVKGFVYNLIYCWYEVGFYTWDFEDGLPLYSTPGELSFSAR
jgi:hypothetical protein